MTTKDFYVRKFINKPGHHTVASVLASIGRGEETNFILSDCDRTIKLEFNGYDRAGRTNALHKAQTLIDVFTEFKTALESYYEAHPLERRRRDW